MTTETVPVREEDRPLALPDRFPPTPYAPPSEDLQQALEQMQKWKDSQ